MIFYLDFHLYLDLRPAFKVCTSGPCFHLNLCRLLERKLKLPREYKQGRFNQGTNKALRAFKKNLTDISKCALVSLLLLVTVDILQLTYRTDGNISLENT